jgi:hypothetical protein
MLKSFLESIGNIMGTRKEEDAICQCGWDNKYVSLGTCWGTHVGNSGACWKAWWEPIAKL